MSLKDKVLSEGMKLVSHPSVAPLLQDERLMKLFMTALSVPGRLDELTAEQKANFSRIMGVARQQEVDDLKRTVRALEGELAQLRAQLNELKQNAS